jgi:hypothetical protein
LLSFPPMSWCCTTTEHILITQHATLPISTATQKLCLWTREVMVVNKPEAIAYIRKARSPTAQSLAHDDYPACNVDGDSRHDGV